jgi:HEAT repeat protein
VISKLVSALENESEYIRGNACKALVKMAEKAATNEVINKLVVLVNSDTYPVSYDAANAIGNILNSSAVLAQLVPKIVSDLCMCEKGSNWLKNVTEDELIAIFFTTQDPDWLPAVTQFVILKAAAVIAAEDKVVVYGRKEPFQLTIPNFQLRQQLIQAFTDEAKRLHLYLEMLLEARNK